MGGRKAPGDSPGQGQRRRGRDSSVCDAATSLQEQAQARRRCCDYILGHADMMHYDAYLAAGYPIGSGVIEGACRHLLQDCLDLVRRNLDRSECGGRPEASRPPEQRRLRRVLEIPRGARTRAQPPGAFQGLQATTAAGHPKVPSLIPTPHPMIASEFLALQRSRTHVDRAFSEKPRRLFGEQRQVRCQVEGSLRAGCREAIKINIAIASNASSGSPPANPIDALTQIPEGEAIPASSTDCVMRWYPCPR